jgi:hypothetical protein
LFLAVIGQQHIVNVVINVHYQTLETARDVAKKLMAAREERRQQTNLPVTADSFDYPLIVGF